MPLKKSPYFFPRILAVSIVEMLLFFKNACILTFNEFNISLCFCLDSYQLCVVFIYESYFVTELII